MSDAPSPPPSMADAGECFFQENPDVCLLLSLETESGHWLIRRANRAAAQLWGENAEALVGRPAAGLAPEDFGLRLQQLADRVRSGTAGEAEFTARFPSGLRTLSVRLSPLPAGPGSTVSIALFGRDVTQQREAEEASREARTQAEQAMQELALQKHALDQHAIVAITDPKGRITYANDKFCEISGYARSELLGKTHSIIKSGLHDITFYRELWGAITSGRIWRAEVCNRRKNGELYWVDTTIVPFRDSQGKPRQYVAIRTDITPMKKAEAALRESEARLATAFESIPFDFWITDRDNRYILQNQTSVRSWGNQVGRLPTDLGLSETTLQRWATIHQRVLAGQIVAEEVTYRRDEQERIYQSIVAPVRTNTGIIGTVGINIDITDRRRAENEVRRVRDLLDSILGAIEDVVWSAETNGRFLYISPSAERVYGRPVSELVDNPKLAMEVVVAEDLPAIRQATATLLSEGKKDLEYRIRRPDGGIVWLHDRARAIRHSDGTVIRYDGIATDITARKRVEQILQESEARHRAVFEGTVDAIFVADPDTGCILDANPRACALIGRPLSELRGLHQTQLHPPQIEERSRRTFSTAIAARGPQIVETFVQHRDGHRIPVEVSSGGILQAGSKRLHFGIFRDITERRQAEAALRASERRYRLLFENMTSGFALHEVYTDADNRPIDYRFLEANPAYERLTGLKVSHIIGRTVREVLPGIESYWIERFGTVAITGQPIRFENYAASLQRWYDTYAFCPEPGQFAVVFNDVTERKRAEDDLLESRTRYKALFEASPDAIFVIAQAPEERGRIISANPSAAMMHGYSLEELQAMRIDEIVSDAAALREVRARIDALSRGERLTFEATHRRRDGSLFHLEVTACHIVLGGVEHLLAIERDITERRRALEEKAEIERRLQETQKLESLGVLAGGIAHDFNNLLTGILANASLVQLDVPPQGPSGACLLAIERSARQAAELCKQMLAYSGRGRFEIRAIDLADLVRSTTELLHASISKAAVLEQELPAGLPPVEGDAVQLRQVVMNLVINASEALPGGTGRIRVAARAEKIESTSLARTLLSPDLPSGDYLTLEVADTGCGMSPETARRVFDPFFTTKFTGRGLGLSAVLGIIRGHRGAITVESALGQGTTFRIHLPVASQAAIPAPLASSSDPDWRGSGTLLVIDDEETVRSVSARVLQRIGFTVILACDGPEGIEIFRRDPAAIRAVILDLTMPRMGGEETFRHLKALRADIPILLASGYDERDTRLRFGELGIAGFIQKPFRVEDLRSRVREVLEGHPPATST